MEETKTTPERYFRKNSRAQYRDGLQSIIFRSWPNKPTFDIWMHWPLCARKECIVAYRCTYGEQGKHCRIIRNRISRILSHIEEAFKDNPLSIEKLARIGAELVPLYAQLVRAQLYDEQRTMMVENPDDFDSPKYSWAYREVQHVIKLIGQTWRDIGIYNKATRTIKRTTNLSNNPTKEPEEQEPELSHYEKLEKRHGVKKQ